MAFAPNHPTRRQKLQQQFRRVKSRLSLTTLVRQTSRQDSGTYQVANEYADDEVRKPSESSVATTVDTDYVKSSTSLDFDFDLDRPVTALPEMPCLPEPPKQRKVWLPDHLARLQTRISNLTSCGYTKIEANAEEKAAIKEAKEEAKEEAKRQKSLARTARSGTPSEPYGMTASQSYYGSYANGAADWRCAMAYMHF